MAVYHGRSNEDTGIGSINMIYAGTQNSTLYAIYPYGNEYWQKTLTGTINNGLALSVETVLLIN